MGWKSLFSTDKRVSGQTADDHAYRIEVVDGIAIATAIRKPTFDETLSAVDCLAHGKVYHRRIWDLSRIEFPYSMDDLRQFADYGKKIFTEKSRYAIVVKDDVGYGSVRAFAAHREQDSRSSGMVFRSVDKAIEWLRDEPAT